jgi:formate hydrogenlyase subunit 3/multisubunit Na+/H+ antiporter MnhD subunit
MGTIFLLRRGVSLLVPVLLFFFGDRKATALVAILVLLTVLTIELAFEATEEWEPDSEAGHCRFLGAIVLRIDYRSAPFKLELNFQFLNG